jgi:hypothetical protein
MILFRNHWYYTKQIYATTVISSSELEMLITSGSKTRIYARLLAAPWLDSPSGKAFRLRGTTCLSSSEGMTTTSRAFPFCRYRRRRIIWSMGSSSSSEEMTMTSCPEVFAESFGMGRSGCIFWPALPSQNLR